PPGAPRRDDAELGDALFRFDARGVLVAVDTTRDAPTADEAATWMRARAARVTREAGAPSEEPPAETAAYLREASLRRAAYTFRFRDYAADVSAVSMGARGFVLREQYRTVAN